MSLFRWQRGAARLLDHEHRVGLCRYAEVNTSVGVGVELVTTTTTTTRGGETKTHTSERGALTGLQTCGSVWVCPCCSARISETRRREMNTVLAWARGQRLVPVMLTLTARHGRRDQLDELLDAMKRAKKALHQHRAWRQRKARIAGSITATEVTDGRNGWHPHFHAILLVDADDEAGGVELIEGLRGAWMGSLAGVGLDGNGAAFQVQGAAQAGEYVAKWGAAEEVTLSGSKRAKGGGRTPLQLLADATDEDDRQAAARWREYARVFQGRRQLVWSRGLKAAAGVNEVSDAEAAEEGGQPAETVEQVRDLRAQISHAEWVGSSVWRGARTRRGRVLNAVETTPEDLESVIGDGEPDPIPDPVDLIEELPEPEGGRPLLSNGAVGRPPSGGPLSRQATARLAAAVAERDRRPPAVLSAELPGGPPQREQAGAP